MPVLRSPALGLAAREGRGVTYPFMDDPVPPGHGEHDTDDEALDADDEDEEADEPTC